MPVKKKKKKTSPKKKTVGKVIRKTKVRAGVKPLKARPRPKAKAKRAKKEELAGIVTHYFPHVKAAVLKVKLPLAVGETIKIKGHTTDFKQQITSMQIDRVPITNAKKGDEIGLMVESRVRRKDKVFKAKS